MFKNIILAAFIAITSHELISAQDIFWSFSPTELVQSYEMFLDAGFDEPPESIYIFSDGLFGFDALDLDFQTSDSDVVQFTGGEAFNSSFLGSMKFDVSTLSVDPSGESGNLFAVNVVQFGVDPALSSSFDPDFVEGVGPNGAVLLARLDFDIVGDGEAEFVFALGDNGALRLPIFLLNPSFGSATLSVQTVTPKIGNCLGDVNLSGTFPFSGADIDVFDIAPFIALLASGTYQVEADCNRDGFVDFRDIRPFAIILGHGGS
jgi:hypothetical protein